MINTKRYHLLQQYRQKFLAREVHAEEECLGLQIYACGTSIQLFSTAVNKTRITMLISSNGQAPEEDNKKQAVKQLTRNGSNVDAKNIPLSGNCYNNLQLSIKTNWLKVPILDVDNFVQTKLINLNYIRFYIFVQKFTICENTIAVYILKILSEN